MVSRQHKPQVTEAETAESSSLVSRTYQCRRRRGRWMDGRLVERKGLVVVVVVKGVGGEKGVLPDNIGRQFIY